MCTPFALQKIVVHKIFKDEKFKKMKEVYLFLSVFYVLYKLVKKLYY